MKTVIETKTGPVDCYGELHDDSNFDVVCEDEDNDTIWVLGNTDTNEPFKSWAEAVEYFQTKQIGCADVVEVSAI